MATQIVLPPDLQALVDKRLASGAYESPEDVLRQALEAQDAEIDWTEDERAAISEHLAEGLRQAERGELLSEEEVKADLAEFKERWIREHQSR